MHSHEKYRLRFLNDLKNEHQTTITNQALKSHSGECQMKPLLVGIAFALCISLTSCALNNSTPSSYSEYVNAAKTAHAKAIANKNVWQQKKMKLPYVEHYLAKANEAKQKGDNTTAMEYAKKAYKFANAEVAQIDAWKTLKPAWQK